MWDADWQVMEVDGGEVKRIEVESRTVEWEIIEVDEE